MGRIEYRLKTIQSVLHPKSKSEDILWETAETFVLDACILKSYNDLLKLTVTLFISFRQDRKFVGKLLCRK